jgi:hypothetical protein
VRDVLNWLSEFDGTHEGEGDPRSARSIAGIRGGAEEATVSGAVLGVCSVFRDQFVVGAMQSRAGGSWRLTAEVVALQAQTRGRRRR